MKYNKLGNSNMKVSRLSLGCVTFGREIGSRDSYRIMDHAVDCGMNYFDTAEAYGNGSSEIVIGSWLKERKFRSQLYIGTKLLPPYTPEKIFSSCDKSLKRLGTDVIDLYQLHSFHESALLSESLEALEELIQKGKIRYLGISNFTENQLKSFLAMQKKLHLTQIISIQNNHNLAIGNLNKELLDYCGEAGIGSISFSPLAAGFLTGKYKTKIPPGSRFDIQPGHQELYFNDAGRKALEKIESEAAETGKSMIEIALSWVLKNPKITTTLIGGRKVQHIEQALQLE